MNGGMGWKININDAFKQKQNQLEQVKKKITYLEELLQYQKKIVQELVIGNK